MRFTLFLRVTTLIALATLASTARAQPSDATGPSLTIEEALQLANRNNPDLQQTRNNRRAAGAALRSAYGSLLPSADAALSSQFREGGTQPINGVTFETSDIRQSSYWLGLQYSLSPATLIAPRVQKANLDAADADVTLSSETVRADVRRQYLNSLQAEATAALQDTLVISAQGELELARARAAVGAGTQLDIARAEVTLGQQRVQALQAHNTAEVEKLRLFQIMGVPQPPNVRLTSTFTVSEPAFTLESVLELAQQHNPALTALRARDRSAGFQVRQAQSQYLPTLSLSTGWGGYTYEFVNPEFLVQQAQFGAAAQFGNCVTQDSLRVGAGLAPRGNCGAPVLSPNQIAAIRGENSQFPFDFARAPWSLSASLSVPIFDGFSREQRIQEAQVNRSNARYRVRALDLQLRQEATAAYLTLVTAARAVALQEQNVLAAREELRLAQERYRVGASTFLDITQARASFERAENDRINAIYDYHRAHAALESAVGRPLR
ncbi:MAG: TolC family protein [Gemmatimonadota bacterium]|nr:TolC family protein [Gemmatimonadota bacterium]